MFHNDLGEDTLKVESLSSYVFFNTPYEALVKTVAMMVGEIDFNNMPIGIQYAMRDGNISTSLCYIFFLVFIFMMVMVLMNLLNGLAVSDIDGIIKSSKILHQKQMIRILADFEEKTIINKNKQCSRNMIV